MNEAVRARFAHYPVEARQTMTQLREVILAIAADLDLGEVEESLKWGEPSYCVTKGSPVRIDWKLKSPNHCFIFFNCQTKLVDTFRELYGDTLEFQGNRAIVLCLEQPLPRQTLTRCLELALTYQSRKHLPLLGAQL